MTLTPRTRLRFNALLTVAFALAALVVAAPNASAAATLSRSTLSATVSGTSVTATARITATSTTWAGLAGICARSGSGANVDFPHAAVSLTSSGVTVTRTKSFSPGTYTYWACAKINGIWQDIGAKQSFTVTGSATGAAPPTGTAMPTGNISGWKQVWAEDFNTGVARGSFPGAYSGKLMSYSGFTDTSKNGDYNQKIISVQNGALDMYLHTQNGRAQGAAPIPLVNGKWGGQVYGRYSVRFKADPIHGYGLGWLLWPDSDDWNDGEVDFPESGLDGTIWGFNHCLGNAAENCLWFDSRVSYGAGWHTTTVDWTKDKLVFYIDGKVVASTTSNVPTKPLHWVLQTSTTHQKPDASTSGHVLIDWMTIYQPA